jgi:hypothetical protein
VRLTVSGAPDRRFGQAGTVVIRARDRIEERGLTITSDRVVIAIERFRGVHRSDVGLVALTPDGPPRPTV